MGFINIEQLVALRTAKGWDQKQLAEAAGIDRSVISRLERGLQADCRVSILVAIAAALDVPPDVLILDIRNGNVNNIIPELEAALLRLRGQSKLTQYRMSLLINAFLQGLDVGEVDKL